MEFGCRAVLATHEGSFSASAGSVAWLQARGCVPHTKGAIRRGVVAEPHLAPVQWLPEGVVRNYQNFAIGLMKRGRDRILVPNEEVLLRTSPCAAKNGPLLPVALF